MLKDITIGQYIPGDSFVHKLDPRTKILISFIFIASLFIVDKFWGYIFIIAFLGATVLISKLQFKYLYKGLKPVFLLIAITAALNIFMIKGTEDTLIWHWKFLYIYKEGIRTAIFMALRLILLIMGTSVLTLTTSPIELTDGIESLLKPFKKIGVPAHELAMMMTIALRFIPTLIDETDKIMKAQKAKSLIPLLIPLFISSFRRADELAMAMEARCYRGGDGRTRMKILKYSKNDFISFGMAGVLLVLSIVVRVF